MSGEAVTLTVNSNFENPASHLGKDPGLKSMAPRNPLSPGFSEPQSVKCESIYDSSIWYANKAAKHHSFLLFTNSDLSSAPLLGR